MPSVFLDQIGSFVYFQEDARQTPKFEMLQFVSYEVPVMWHKRKWRVQLVTISLKCFSSGQCPPSVSSRRARGAHPFLSNGILRKCAIQNRDVLILILFPASSRTFFRETDKCAMKSIVVTGVLGRPCLAWGYSVDGSPTIASGPSVQCPHLCTCQDREEKAIPVLVVLWEYLWSQGPKGL